MGLKKSIQWAIATDISMRQRFRGLDERAKLKGAILFDSVHNYAQFILLWRDTFWMFQQVKEKDKKRWLLKELERLEEKEWQLAKEVYKDLFNLQEKEEDIMQKLYRENRPETYKYDVSDTAEEK